LRPDAGADEPAEELAGAYQGATLLSIFELVRDSVGQLHLLAHGWKKLQSRFCCSG
jgi:hypothetical protein